MIRSITNVLTSCLIVILSIGQAAFALSPINSIDKKPVRGASCPTCSATSSNPFDRLATLGKRIQNNPFLPLKHSLFKGLPINFVSSSTGELSLAVTDLAFGDNPLLLFQRTYNSSRNEDSGLGRGWSFAFNDSITFSGDTAVLTNAAGDKFVYHRTDEKNYILQTPEPADIQSFQKENGDTISANNGDVTKIYKRLGSTFYLSEINAPNGWEVSIKRASGGKITNISSISGQITFNWSNGNNPQLLAVTDSAGRRISFGQSNGLLQSSTTAIGGVWKYEYANGRLSRAVDPTNRVALLAKYDASGRVSGFGDSVGMNNLAYKLNANNISTITTVTDSLNYTRAFQQNGSGITTLVTDQKARCSIFCITKPIAWCK